MTTQRDVVLDSSGTRTQGQVLLQFWSSRDAFWRGAKKAIRIVGVVLLCCLPFAFLEPFLFLIWGSVVIGILFLLVGPYLHFKYWNETVTFEFVQGQCPACKKETRLTPYLSSKVEKRFTVHCPECGQTSQASLVNPLS